MVKIPCLLTFHFHVLAIPFSCSVGSRPQQTGGPSGDGAKLEWTDGWVGCVWVGGVVKRWQWGGAGCGRLEAPCIVHVRWNAGRPRLCTADGLTCLRLIYSGPSLSTLYSHWNFLPSLHTVHTCLVLYTHVHLLITSHSMFLCIVTFTKVVFYPVARCLVSKNCKQILLRTWWTLGWPCSIDTHMKLGCGLKKSAKECATSVQTEK